MHMIGETSLMMGFTFIVGMAFAYVLKLMTYAKAIPTINEIGRAHV